MSWGWYSYPKKPKPRRVVGGLKLKSGSEIVRTWWGKRWLEVLESFGWHTRLERGRRYARSGQVLSIQIEKGLVEAQVQGSRSKPYHVEITVPPISSKDWLRVTEGLAGSAFYSAKLLSGEMPSEIEGIFRKVRISLFPGSKKDMTTDCSCPDWENPCKHIAAVYYLLAQEFDRDPFLLFKIRGLERNKLLMQIRLRRSGESVPSDPDGWKEGSAGEDTNKITFPDPGFPSGLDVSGGINSFFRLRQELPDMGKRESDFLLRLPRPGGRIKEMGVPPFWQGENDFEPSLGRLYQAVRKRTLEILGSYGMDIKSQKQMRTGPKWAPNIKRKQESSSDSRGG